MLRYYASSMRSFARSLAFPKLFIVCSRDWHESCSLLTSDFAAFILLDCSSYVSLKNVVDVSTSFRRLSTSVILVSKSFNFRFMQLTSISMFSILATSDFIDYMSSIIVLAQGGGAVEAVVKNGPGGYCKY